jgi:hypothetical protein
MLSDLYYKHKLYCVYYANIIWLFSEIMFVKKYTLLSKTTEYLDCATLVNWLTALSIVLDSWEMFIQSVYITKSTTIWDVLLCRLVESYLWEISRIVRLRAIMSQKKHKILQFFPCKLSIISVFTKVCFRIWICSHKLL